MYPGRTSGMESEVYSDWIGGINMENFTIEFKGRKSFDTREEAMEFSKTLGDKYKACYKVEYPDCVFYIVEFEEE